MSHLRKRASHHITLIKPNGTEEECHAASVHTHANLIYIYRLDEHKVRPEINDVIRWHRPAEVGGTDDFVVLEPNLSSGKTPLGLFYSVRVRYRGAADPAKAGDTYHITITNNGHNSRATIKGQDHSANTITITNHQAFHEIREAAAQIADAGQRTAVLEATTALEQAQGQPHFSERYARLMALAANHFEVFGPLMPILAQLAHHAHLIK